MVMPRLRFPFITYLPAPSASRLGLRTTTLFRQFYSVLGTQRPTANHGSLASADLYSFFGAVLASSPKMRHIPLQTCWRRNISLY